ncbi:MAG: hypothetical protein HN704_12865 [Bacteroidetes bacterium]|jgi:hypothetical protein|nr:hypothetical protein [Bacteroidota bacterium]MBT6686757.1 hypothetical protein [Bacteroidota bacterium]MBT7142004.1 hypothetical protein [Bacteroidota bacterium]MBT7492486.1 hypothetical protein [Bacteroidota bacterium]
MSDYNPKKKGLLTRFVELYTSINILKDLIKQIDNGKSYLIIPIIGQLRSLLCEKSSKSKSLLIDIAEILDYQTEFYFIEQNIITIDSAKGLVFGVTPPILSVEKQDFNQKKTNLDEYLKKELIQIETKYYSIEDLIKLFSNKLGGSHYSLSIAEPEEELLNKNIGFGNTRVLEEILLRLSKIVLEIGIRFIRKYSEFDFYLGLYIPEQSFENEFNPIVDYRLNNNTSRLSFGAAKNGNYFISLHDLSFRNIQFTSKNKISFNTELRLNFYHEVTDEFKSVIKIIENDKVIIEEETYQPIFLLNEFWEYESAINRLIDSKQNGCNLAIKAFTIYNNAKRDKSKIDYLNEIGEYNKNKTYTWYRENEYCISEPGTNDFKIFGDLERKEI